MVNELRALLHDSSDHAPYDEFDPSSIVRSGRTRVRRRRATMIGAAGLAAAAVVAFSTLALDQDPKADDARPTGPVTEPVGEVLSLSDATSADLTPIYSTVLDLDDFDKARLIDGITDDGQAVVRDARTLSKLSLVDVASGEEQALPDVGGRDIRLLEASDDRLVYASLKTSLTTRQSKVGVSIHDRSSDTWSQLSWPDLPAGRLLGIGIGSDDRLYVGLNPDATGIEDSFSGMTGALWSVSLTDADDVRDEDRVVGAIAVDGNHVVWGEVSQGVSSQLTVRDLDTGDEASFDPRSGADCVQTGLGIDAERIVMSQDCVVEAGSSDSRIQVVSLTGEPVVTVQDASITGYADQGGHAIITSTGPDNAGTYTYDLASGDFVRLGTSAPDFMLPQPGPVADGYLLWRDGTDRGSSTQKVAKAP